MDDVEGEADGGLIGLCVIGGPATVLNSTSGVAFDVNSSKNINGLGADDSTISSSMFDLALAICRATGDPHSHRQSYGYFPWPY